jgi:hypothetical protein
MSCQVLRCGRAGRSATVPGGASWVLCDGHRGAIADGEAWTADDDGWLLVGADALYDLPRGEGLPLLADDADAEADQ